MLTIWCLIKSCC